MTLPWIRLDTNLPTHDKIITLAGAGDKGLAAAFVYVSSLAHSGGHDTSGFIAKGALPFVHAKPAHTRLLVEARLWEYAEGGYRIVNWGDRNLTGASQQVVSEERAKAGRKGADKRWQTDN